MPFVILGLASRASDERQGGQTKRTQVSFKGGGALAR